MSTPPFQSNPIAKLWIYPVILVSDKKLAEWLFWNCLYLYHQFMWHIRKPVILLYAPRSFLTKTFLSQFDYHLWGRPRGEQFLASPPNQIHQLRMNTKSVKNLQQHMPTALKANSKVRLQRSLEQRPHYWKMCAAFKVNSYIILHKL